MVYYSQEQVQSSNDGTVGSRKLIIKIYNIIFIIKTSMGALFAKVIQVLKIIPIILYFTKDNKLKQGKIIPGANIPIISKENIKKKPDSLIVLAWNFFNEIKRENKHLSKQIISIKDLEK